MKIYKNIKNIKFVSNFLNVIPKAEATKDQIDKMDLMKTENLWIKRNYEENKKATCWEKTFARQTTDKGLISGIYKELLKLYNNETTEFKNGQRLK